MNIEAFIPTHLHALSPYQVGKPISELARELNMPTQRIIKLASNENPLGMSLKVQNRLNREMKDMTRYPDGNGFELKNALSNYFNLPPEYFILGNGSNDILELIARTLLTPEHSVIYSEYAFAVYYLITQAIGAKHIQTPALNWGHDLNKMQESIQNNTRLIFIANPNNPTGTLLSEAQLIEFLSNIPKTVFVVLDEAYTEYLPDEHKINSLKLLAQFPNLIISRTFSKAYGLASLRVGFAMCSPEILGWINRIRQPFNVNSFALAAASEALQDIDYIKESIKINREGMQQITQGLATLNLKWIPSSGNFVTFHCQNAPALNQWMLKNGLIIRPLTPYQMPNSLRVTIGLKEENARFLEVLNAAPKEYL